MQYIDPKQKVHKNTFTISLYNCSEDAARQYYDSFSGNYNIYDSAEIMARNYVKCVELDEYYEPYYQRFMKKYNSIVKKSPEWLDYFTEERRKIIEIEKEVLDNKIFCSSAYDIGYLLALKKKIEFDWVLVDKYGWNLIEMLASSSFHPNRIQLLSTSCIHPETFDKALNLGLAKKGSDMSLKSILDCMTATKLEQLVKSVSNGSFKKISDYISFINSLPSPLEIINKVFPIEDIYIFLPIKEDDIKAGLFDAAIYWQYCIEASSFVFNLFYSKDKPPKYVYIKEKINQKIA